MKNLTRFSMPVIVLCFTLNGMAQTGIFKTYEDFLNGKMEEVETYKSYYHVMGNVSLKFVNKEGKKVKYSCSDIWGFMYKKALFRTVNYDQPARVISMGKIVYYENGIAHLDMIKNESQSGNFSIGYYCYLSKDLNSKPVPMPGALISDAKKKVNKFKQEHPEYKELFDCIEKDYSYSKVRQCVIEFEKE